MRRLSFAIISDTLFLTASAFIISFALLRYFFDSYITAAICSGGTGIAVGAVSLFALCKKRRNKLSSADGGKKQLALAIFLALNGDKAEECMRLSLGGERIAENFYENETCAYSFVFRFSPVDCDGIADVIKLKTEKAKSLYCLYISPEAEEFAENFGIEIYALSAVYALLKERNALPAGYEEYIARKPKILNRIRKRFKRKLCLPLFFSGVTLIFFSCFTFYATWYIVSGSALILLSVAAFILKAK